MKKCWNRLVRCGLLSAVAGLAGSSAAHANQVQAQVEGSLLVIAGDTAGNQIVVAQNLAGDVTVTGQNGTLVNGFPRVRFPQTPLNAVEMLMGDGNDVVTLRNLQIANDLFANLGPGADRLVASASAPTIVGANATVEAAEGNDIVRLENMAVGSNLNIDGGLGTLNATLTGLNVGFAITVIGDDANDVVTMSNTASGDIVSIETKGGSDRVTMTNVETLIMGIHTDANGLVGIDRVSLMSVTTVEDLGIFTGPGNDTVLLADVATGKNLTVSADEGNDRVSGTGVAAAFDAIFEGGAGTDTLEDFGITGGTKKEIKEFEIVLP